MRSGPAGGVRGGGGRCAQVPPAAPPTTAGARGAAPAAATVQPDLGGFGGGRGGRGAGPAWEPNIGGCESGFTLPDPTDADVVYATCYGDKVARRDARTGTARSIEPWLVSLDSPPNETKYRCHWTAPMAIDPF